MVTADLPFPVVVPITALAYYDDGNMCNQVVLTIQSHKGKVANDKKVVCGGPKPTDRKNGELSYRLEQVSARHDHKKFEVRLQ